MKSSSKKTKSFFHVGLLYHSMLGKIGLRKLGMQNKLSLEKLMTILIKLFLLVLGSLFIAWLILQKPQGIGLLLSGTCFVSFMLAVFWSLPKLKQFFQSTNPEINELSKAPYKHELKKIIGMCVIFILLVDLGVMVMVKMRFPDLSLLKALEMYFYVTPIDADHYFKIAQFGYESTGHNQLFIVFFPLYPLLIKGISIIIPNIMLSGMLLNHGLVIAGTILLYRLFRLDMNQKIATFAVMLFLLMPGSFFAVLPMTEALFTFLMVSAIYCVRTHRWKMAGLCTLLCTLTRSTGAVLLVFLGFELFKKWHKEGFSLKDIIILLMPVLGLAIYCVINYVVFGNPLQFTIFQKEHWGQQLNLFFQTPYYLYQYFLSYLVRQDYRLLFGLSLPNLLFLIGTPILLAKTAKKIRVSYLFFALAYFAYTIGVTWLLSAPRYLSVLFVIPYCVAGLCDTKSKRIITGSIMALLCFCFFGMFLLGYPIY